jgi:sulfate transport system substrate-binding protein
MRRIVCFAFILLSSATVQAKDQTLLNVSYDPTRELYAAFNAAFATHWKTKAGDTVKVTQSHGGSGKQARAVIDGQEADVVTLALGYDVDAIADAGPNLPKNWQKQLPFNASPYTSTIVFVVRGGNPKAIKDWDDLTRPDVKVITPNPKTSGGARWNYLAAWGYARAKLGGDDAKVRDFMTRLYRNVPVMDSGARGSTTTFAQKKMGDVLIAWENEAFLMLKEMSKEKFEIVSPSMSILAEPPVAVVTKFAEKHGTAALAKAYLEYLYSPEGQEIIATSFYRPRDPKVAAKHASQFPKIKMLTIDGNFGGWRTAQKTHFEDGGTFDQILGKK